VGVETVLGDVVHRLFPFWFQQGAVFFSWPKLPKICTLVVENVKVSFLETECRVLANIYS
jgi:hypothetical protein